MTKYLSNRVKRTPQSALSTDRYQYLGLNQAEPNLGDPILVYPPIPVGDQYQLITVLNDPIPGSRYWIPTGGGLIPGTISVYDEGYLVGSSSSITQLNFVGTAVSAQAVPLGIAATITISPPGNNGELLFKSNGDFATSTNLIYNSTTGILTANNGINIGFGGTAFVAYSSGLVGVGTTNPTQELHIQGDLRLTGTVYDFYNNPGFTAQLLIKNSLGGIEWINQGSVTAGAGGTYQNVQYHNAAGLLGGASNFVFNEITSRVGIGSTIPRYTLDVLGVFNVVGQSIVQNIYSTGISTLATLNVGGLTTTTNLQVTNTSTLNIANVTHLTSQNLKITGITTLGVTETTNLTSQNVVTQNLYASGITTLGVTNTSHLTSQNLKVTGITTVGFLTGTNAFYTGIVTANTFVGNFQGTNNQFENILVTGIATITNLKITGIATLGFTTTTSLNAQNLKVSGITTLNGAYINNVSIGGNTISTPIGNLILNSASGTTQIIDIVYVDDSTRSISTTTGALVVNGGVGIGSDVNIGGYVSIGGTLGVAGITSISNTTQSTTKDTGALVVEGGVGIEKNLNVGGNVLVYNDLNVTGIASVSNTTQSSTKDSGALVVEGGVGIEKNLNVGGLGFITGISTFGSTVLPNSNGTQNLGSTTQKWNNIYANTFVGAIIGNSDTATKLQTARTISATSDITWSVSFDGSASVTAAATLANSGVVAGTYGSSTQVPVFAVDAKGRVTSVTNTGINFSTATVQNADNIKTTSRSTSATHYLTFVDSDNATSAYESLYTDSGITYNPSTDLLTTSTLLLGTGSYLGSSPLVINGTTGDNDSQLLIKKPSQSAYSVLAWDGQVFQSANIYYSDGSWVHSAPTANNNNQLFVLKPGSGVRWYASNNALGSWNVSSDVQLWNDAGVWQSNVSGNSATASKLQNARSISATSDITWSVSFDGSVDVTAAATLANSGVVAGTYGSSTLVPVFVVDSKGRVTSVTNTGINFSSATVAQADKLTNARSISATSDISWSVSFDGSTNVTAAATLASSGVVAGTYGSSTTVPVFAVDGKGRVTSVTNTGINFSTATVAQSDTIKTTSTSTSAVYYPTFVSSNTTGIYQTLYTDTDTGITYNPNTDLLTVGKIKPAAIQDTSGGTGTANYVLTSNGSGGWSWASVVGGGSPAISGITIQEEGSTVGTALGTQILNFIGGSITATSPTAGTANITVTASSNVTVTQTGYGCANPITVSGGSAINIASSSNSYGRRFLSATDPTLSGTICDGDIWYSTVTGGVSGGYGANQVLYQNSSNITSSSASLQFDGTNLTAANNVTVNGVFTSSSTTYLNGVANFGSNVFITGNLYVTGDITAFYTSDKRLKENITPIPNALNKVLSISGNTFKWSEKSGKKGIESGIIAQEILEVLPEAVVTRDNGYLAVHYDKIIPLLIEAIKDLKKQVDNNANNTSLTPIEKLNNSGLTVEELKELLGLI